MDHPKRIQRLVIFNAPHPIRFLKSLCSPGQLRRSWYVLAFQLPWLPERLIEAGTSKPCVEPWVANQPAGAFTAQHIDRYVAAATQPRALRAATNYYRGPLRSNPLGRCTACAALTFRP